MGIQTLAPLEHATVKVQYVNQPKEGKKMGSIRDTEGDYYGVRLDKLNEFQVAETYEISFRDNNGYRDVVAVKRAPQQKPAGERPYTVVETANPRPAGAQQTNEFYRPTSPEDKKSMFRCACVTAAIKSRQVALTRDHIVALIEEIDAGYDLAVG